MHMHTHTHSRKIVHIPLSLSLGILGSTFTSVTIGSLKVVMDIKSNIIQCKLLES